ncbi:MAG: hypothetical protein JKY65_28220 [Planctomycetes bacterium]|nr:hypothetical protein [Planctomycetota bacterium]
MSDGAWLEADEVGFEHHPDIAEWMNERGCSRARVVLAAQVEGNRWTLLECATGALDDPEGEITFRAIAQGDEALLESEDPAWLSARERLEAGSQSR